MIHRPELLDALQRAHSGPLEIEAWRHVFGSHLPDQENTSGARWNPSGVAAIYLGCTRDGAVAEGNHAIAVQPLRPRALRFIYAVQVTLANVLDLRDTTTLHDVGLTHADIAGDDLSACQEVGAAADWLERDGLLVQSARSSAMNLIIYPAHRRPDAVFEYGDGEELS